VLWRYHSVSLTLMRDIRQLILSCAMLLPLLSTAQYLGGYFTSINSGANNYSIDLTTYTDSISLDDHCHAVIEIWNATGTVMISQDTLDRSNGGPGNCDSLVGAGEYLSQGVMRNRYHLDYQFPGQGNYLLRFTGQNLSSGILNIGAQQAMVVEYELYVNPFGANDHSATIVNDAVMAACLGTTFGFDPLWMDAEGDSLAFSLGVPDGVAMYASPSTLADTLTVDSHSGQLHLVDPQVVGWLLFLVECKAYRNGLLQGRTLYPIDFGDGQLRDHDGGCTIKRGCLSHLSQPYHHRIHPSAPAAHHLRAHPNP
jgi:hypothetical protein